MYSIKSYMCSLSELPVTVSTHLFDSLVRPILTYNCEIWNMDTYKAGSDLSSDSPIVRQSRSPTNALFL